MSVTLSTTSNVISLTESTNDITLTVGNPAITLSLATNSNIDLTGFIFRKETIISYTDFTSGSKSIGNIPLDRRINKVAVIITTAFNEGTLVIGDELAHGRLMTSSDNNLLSEQIYHTEPDYKYSDIQEIKIWFETGAPTQGSAIIIIYYS